MRVEQWQWSCGALRIANVATRWPYLLRSMSPPLDSNTTALRQAWAFAFLQLSERLS